MNVIGNIAATVEGLDDADMDQQVLGWLEELYASLAGHGTPADALRAELGWILAWWAGGRDEGTGDHARARDIARRVIEDATAALGPDDPGVLNARRVLAHQLGKLGDGQRALAISREVAGTAARIYGEDHSVTVSAREEAGRWEPGSLQSGGLPGIQ